MNKMKKSTWCVIYVFFVIDVLVTNTWKIRRHKSAHLVFILTRIVSAWQAQRTDISEIGTL